MENKMKILLTSLEELKTKEIQDILEEKDKSKVNQKNKNSTKIAELEKKLEISSNQLLNERKQNKRIIEEKNRDLESLKKEIKSYKELEKTYKVKISNLEKDLQREKKGYAYYNKKAGTKTPSRKAKSFYSEGSVSCNESYISSYSKNTTTSYLKKNLIPKNSYQKQIKIV
jgi:chromosome segregation ATPase